MWFKKEKKKQAEAEVMLSSSSVKVKLSLVKLFLEIKLSNSVRSISLSIPNLGLVCSLLSCDVCSMLPFGSYLKGSNHSHFVITVSTTNMSL